MIPMTLKELRKDSDWAAVFGEEYVENCNAVVESTSGCPTDPKPTRENVIQILCYHNGTPDEDDWLGIFLLDDGRWLYASGACDETGWD